MCTHVDSTECPTRNHAFLFTRCMVSVAHWEFRTLVATHSWENELICQRGPLCQRGTCTWLARILRRSRCRSSSAEVRQYVYDWLVRRQAHGFATRQAEYLHLTTDFRIISGNSMRHSEIIRLNKVPPKRGEEGFM